MNVLMFLFAATAILDPCLSVLVSRCDLAKGLAMRGVPREQLDNWICLAEAVSGRKTLSVNSGLEDLSMNYGIFQINSRYWCLGPQTESNGCNIPCAALLNNSLDPDTRCAMRVIKTRGFQSWDGWRDKCEGRDLSFYTAECDLVWI